MVTKYCYLFLPRFCLWRKPASEEITCQFVCLPFSFFYAFISVLYPLPSSMVVWGLYPPPSSLFVRVLILLPYSLVGFLPDWSKFFLVLSFVINTGILLTEVRIFWGWFIRLCSVLQCQCFLQLCSL